MRSARIWKTSRWLYLWLMVHICGASSAGDREEAVDFQRDLRPLFKSRCVVCHGPLQQQGGLRLDSARALLRGGDDGPVIVPGKSSTSQLLERLRADPSAGGMPPQGPRVAAGDVERLQAWIDAGAPVPTAETTLPKPEEHWAFQPLTKPAVPTVRNVSWPANVVDQFILAKLEARGWQPNPPAPRQALFRRLHFDLLGLPPAWEDQAAFAADQRPDAWQRWVHRLLTQPALGERYGRHWLDVVRYADSNGYERDAAKPEVWKYRDYVIQSLNADLPFARFLQEQVAGDELPDGHADSVIATGFHRLGPWDDEPADFAVDRYDQLDDMVSASCQVFLGLTMGCARCHDHKFDPLTQRDYYSLVAVFQPLTRPRSGRTELTSPIALPAARQAMSAEAKKATPQGYFWEESPGPAPATHILQRGNPNQPGTEVQPAVPAVLSRTPWPFLAPDTVTSRRRLSLANWLVSADHPLTARVIVNRMWQWHFGQGLVRTPNDFGLQGESPTHPELLDYLAWWLVHEADWSLKRLHELLVTSATYQQSQQARPEYFAADPDNQWWWRRTPRRLEVEAIRDAMLSVSGQLDSRMFGPPMYPLVPVEALESHADKTKIWPAFQERLAARRTVYAFTKRSLLVPLLEVFDLCDTTRSSPQRTVTTVPTQALALFNGEFTQQQARHFAQRLRAECGPRATWDELLNHAWRLALSRSPTEEELDAMRSLLAQYGSSRPADSRLKSTDVAPAPSVPTQFPERALEEAARVVLNLNEFVYPE